MAERYVGLISGTSMDGIDVAVVDFDRGEAVLALDTIPFDPATRAELDEVRRDPDCFPVAALARLDARLGECFARATLKVLDQAGLEARDIRAIGCHGQTILHRAGPDDEPPHTLQIADPHRIAALTGIAVVADFRRADLAAGGQGAPLAPLIHQALLGDECEHRVVVNLGGIANITVLPAGGGVSGFDTGPANCFLDWWYRQHHDDRFDAEGRWAARGRVDQAWLDRLLADPYYALPPPKSTGIEYFSVDSLRRQLPDWANDRPADIQATLAELTAVSLCDAIRGAAAGTERVLVCGGGAHNHHLIRQIARRLECPVQSTADHGLDPDAVEAVLFAWLAREHLAGRRVDTRSITGARHLIQSGVLIDPPGA
jgi:anhydro-N-acetylmuramic acid kinase